MAIEIERKFLVKNDNWRAHVGSSEQYRQGYLKVDGTTVVRVRIGGERAKINVKGGRSSIRRQEYEYDIPYADATEILDGLCVGSVIEKTRHLVRHAGHTWEIDVFEGDNAGLTVAEIELDDESEPFEHPDWLGEQVSEDPRYRNASLATHPYREWHS